MATSEVRAKNDKQTYGSIQGDVTIRCEEGRTTYGVYGCQ